MSAHVSDTVSNDEQDLNSSLFNSRTPVLSIKFQSLSYWISHFSLLTFPVSATILANLDVYRVILERVGVKITKLKNKTFLEGKNCFLNQAHYILSLPLVSVSKKTKGRCGWFNTNISWLLENELKCPNCKFLLKRRLQLK